MSSVEDRVVIGVDPHKRSVTIAVMAGDEAVLVGDTYSRYIVGAVAHAPESGLLAVEMVKEACGQGERSRPRCSCSSPSPAS